MNASPIRRFNGITVASGLLVFLLMRALYVELIATSGSGFPETEPLPMAVAVGAELFAGAALVVIFRKLLQRPAFATLAMSDDNVVRRAAFAPAIGAFVFALPYAVVMAQADSMFWNLLFIIPLTMIVVPVGAFAAGRLRLGVQKSGRESRNPDSAGTGSP